MMNWKTTAALTGATAIAGWLGFGQPQDDTAAVSNRAASARIAPTSEIEREAIRLQARGRPRAEFDRPSRNPFRFGAGRPAAGGGAASPRGAAPAGPAEAVPLEPLPPQPPVIALSGVATERVDGGMRRTAMLRTPQGLMMVRQGDAVAGEYRVERIEPDAVYLTSTKDGSSRRIGF